MGSVNLTFFRFHFCRNKKFTFLENKKNFNVCKVSSIFSNRNEHSDHRKSSVKVRHTNFTASTLQRTLTVFIDSPRGLLFKKAQATLGLGICMTDMVAVPDGEDPKEWVAVHAVDFFNRISLIYGTLSDQCTRISCSSMTHTNGTKVSFFWDFGLDL